MVSNRVDSNQPSELLFQMHIWQIRAKQYGNFEWWYELYFSSGSDQFEPLGGANLKEFFGNFVRAFETKQGCQLRSMSNPKFSEFVGGAQTEYLGYAVLSSYSTFYIFRDINKKIHVVLADGKGVFKGHVILSADELNDVKNVMTTWINQKHHDHQQASSK